MLKSMVWVILAALGVPLWLCAIGIFTLVYRNRELRHRPGNVPVRRRLPGKKRWSRGHGVWVSDVFAFRGSPAAWQESLLDATSVTRRVPTGDEGTKLRRLAGPVVATIVDDEGRVVEFATNANAESTLLGPFASQTST
jgi:hypothetical protein